MSTETLWQEVAVAALLGTQRKPYRPGQAGGSLDALFAPPGQEGEENERHLLRAIAVTALHRQAGRLPERAAPNPVEPCPPDMRPRCSMQAAACLGRILTAGWTALLPEWLELAGQKGLRVREEQLPLLLDQFKNALDLRKALLPVLGERGQWLAARNPEWSALVLRVDEHTWHEGQRRERLAFLSDLRERDPQQARTLLAGSWKQESPAERVAFLDVLANGLSMADEPFLESALDDKHKSVRQAAALLLARLPASRLAARAVERLRPLLAWKGGLLRNILEVSLPESCDDAMQRDGIEPRRPAGSRLQTGAGLGERAWWFAQLLALVPPRTWVTAWDKRPAVILEAAHKHEWETALLEGWSEAAIRHQDVEWLEALMTHEARRNDGKGMLTLFPRLPVEVKEKRMLGLLREMPLLSYETPTSICLAACRHPWSAELTQAVITAICWTLQRGELQPWRWEKLMRDIPPCFHPDLLETALRRISSALEKREINGMDPYARNLLAVLEFRLEMRRAFTT